jgi:hypothetical protein
MKFADARTLVLFHTHDESKEIKMAAKNLGSPAATPAGGGSKNSHINKNSI